jgi:hypothetical protein
MAWLGTKKGKTAIATLLVLLLALATWLIPRWLHPGYAFQAEVILDRAYHNGHGRDHFTVYVDSGRWLIHRDQHTNGIDYEEDAFDGKYIYRYTQYTRTPSVLAGANTSNGIIGTNDVPDLGGSTDWATAVWLACASARYFDTVKGDRMKSFFFFNLPTPEYDQGPVMQADWTRSTNPPFLPAYVFSKKVNFRYQALQFTNFAGLQIPSEFELDSFGPGGSTNRAPDMTMHGRLVKISRLTGDPDFRPKLDGRTYTEDRRVPGGQNVYLNTDLYWHTVKPTLWQRIKKEWSVLRQKWFK